MIKVLKALKIQHFNAFILGASVQEEGKTGTHKIGNFFNKKFTKMVVREEGNELAS